MIASNYVKNPDAMQYQRELWSKSKRDTIMMRIAGLIMRGGPAPAWVKEAASRAKALARAVQTCCRDWISEAAQAARKPAKGFGAHVRGWNDQRAAERLTVAQMTVREHAPSRDHAGALAAGAGPGKAGAALAGASHVATRSRSPKINTTAQGPTQRQA